MAVTLVVGRTTTLFQNNDEAGVFDWGDVLYTRVTIANTGDTDATNVTFEDNFAGTTLLADTLNISPIAFNDSFTAVANTVLRVGTANTINDGESTFVAGNLLTNDIGAITGDSVTGLNIDPVADGITTNGGRFNIFADGTFNYVNDGNDTEAELAAGDFFTYTVRDAGLDGILGNTDDLTSIARVTISFAPQGASGSPAHRVWYVDATTGSDATGTGTSANPFATMTHLNDDGTDLDGAGHHIYVQGNISGSITLEAGQKLIGTGEELNVAGFTIAADSGTNSALNATFGFGVTLGTDNTIAGVNLGGTGGITGTNFGTLTVTDDVVLNNSGQALNLTNGTFAGTGFAATSSAGGTGNVSLTDVSGSVALGTSGALSAATGHAINVSNTSGAALNTSVTYGGSVTHSGTGALLNVDGGTAGHSGTIALTGTKSATAGTGLNFENADGTYSITGTTTLNGGNAGIDIVSNANGNPAQGSAGSFTFGGAFTITSPTGTAINIADSTANVNADIDVTQANNASALAVANHSGGTLTFQTTGSFSVTGLGNGLQFSNADGIYQVHSANTLGGTDGGIDILADSGGTFTFLVNTAINNSGAGAGFNLDNSDANVTFNGSITDSNGRAVSINEHDAGTITFSNQSSITATGGTGSGIHITNSNGGSVAFNGQVQLTTGGNNAVTLTSNSGSTVTFNADDLGLDISTTTGKGFSATGGGTVTVSGTGNSITSVGGTALEVQNTNIGSGGLNFVSISANGGTNGIHLNTTGTAGGLNVTGSGTTPGSGGTIQNTTGDGILLNSTENVRLANMNISNNGGDGIGGTNVHGLVINRTTFESNGDDPNTDESAINIVGLTGTASNGARPTSISNSTFINNYEFEVQISNSAGTLSNFQFLNNTVTSNGADTGGNLVNFLGLGSAVMGITATGNTFTGNAPATATALHIDTSGTSTHAHIQGNTFTNNNVGVNVSTGPGSTTLMYRIHDNDFTGTRSNAINEFHNGNLPFNRNVHGTITDNVIGTQGVANSGSAVGAGIRIGNEGAVNTTHLISGNTIQSIGTQAVQGNEAIQYNMGLVGSNTGGGTANLTIHNNVMRDIMNARAVVIQDNQQLGINNPGPGPFPTINVSMLGNQFLGTISGQAGNGSYIRLRELNGTFNVTQQQHTGAASAAELDDANGFNNPTLINTSTNIGGSITYGAPAPAAPTTPTLAMQAEAPPLAAPAAEEIEEELVEIVEQQPQVVDGPGPDQPADGAGTPSEDSAPAAPVVIDDGVLSQAELDLIVDAAIQRWIAAGATDEQVAAMRAVNVSVADLPGLQLGESGFGEIIVDSDAAGWRWFIDTTPGADEEYSGSGTKLVALDKLGNAGTRIDLLTVVTHELGHQIGLADTYAADDREELMHGLVNAGERRLPGSDDLDGAAAAPVTGAFAISPINLGTLPAGQTVTIEWRHVVDNPGEDRLVGAWTGQSLVNYDGGTALSGGESGNIDALALTGRIYNDVDKSGAFNAGDTGAANVSLTLYADTNNNGAYDEGVDLHVGYNEINGTPGYQAGIDTPAAPGTGTPLTAATNGSGTYTFSGLAPGDYIVGVSASNFAPGGNLVGKVSHGSPVDPNNNQPLDNNGEQFLTGQAGTYAASRAIRLDYGLETAAGPTGPALDTNDTLDLGFDQPNQPPAIANLAGDSVTWTEGAASPALLDLGSNATVTDADSANFDGGSLTVAITGGGVAGQDVLGIRHQGNAAGEIGVSGGDVSYGGTVIGTFTGGSAGSALAISLDADATHAAVQALLRNITYTNSGGDTPTDGNRTISWTLVDGDGNANGGDDDVTVTTTLNVDPVDDAPVVSYSLATRTFVEGVNGAADSIVVNNTVTISDPDHATFGAVQVIIVGGYVEGQDILAFTNNDASLYGNIAASYDTSIGYLTLTSAGGSATQAQFQNALRAVTYDNVSEEPDQGDRTVQMRALNGVHAIGAGNFTIQVVAQNDSPSGTSSTITINEDAIRTLNASDFGFSDVDGDAFRAVRFGTAPTGGTLFWDADGAGGAEPVAIASFPTGDYLVTDIALGKLTFVPTAESSGSGLGAITFTVVDDGGTTGAGQNADTTPNVLTVDVLPVNDMPAGADKLDVALNEDATYTFAGSDFGFSDPADGNAFAGVAIITAPTAGTLTHNGTPITTIALGGYFVSADDLAANLLTYTPALNGNGDDYASFTFSVRDNGGTANGGANQDDTPNTFSFDVAALNDAPVNTLGGTVTINEDPVNAPLTGMSITDVDAGNDPITVVLGVGNGVLAISEAVVGGLTAATVAGNATGTVTITATVGQINATFADASGVRYTPNPDFNGSDTLTVTTNDGGASGAGGALQDVDTRTITVNPINDEPAGANKTVTGSEDDPYVFTVADFGFSDPIDGNSFFGVNFIAVPTAGTLFWDPDGAGGAAPMAIGDGWNIEGPAFATQLAAGALYYVPEPDGTGSPYASFTFQVKDNGGIANGGDNTSPTYTMTIDVTADNSAPVVDLNGGDAGIDNAASYTEQAPIVTLAAGLELTDDGTTLTGATVRITGGFVPLAGDGADYLGIAGSGSGTVGAISYSYSALTGVLTLSGTASVADYQALLREVSFQSTTNNPGTSRTISWTVNDGSTPSAAATTTLAVTAVNDAPVNTVPLTTQNGTEDANLVFSTANGNAISVSDPDAPSLTVTLSVGQGGLTLATQAGLTSVGGDGTGSVTLTGSAASIEAALDGLTYRGNLNYQGADTLTIVTTDNGLTGTGGALADTDQVSITLADDGTIDGDSGDNNLTGSGIADFFRVEQGGDDILDGGAGDDIFFFGGEFTPADQVTGGSGVDTIGLQGDYSAGLTFGTGMTSNITNVDWISLLSGANTRFGEPGTNRYSYNLTVLDSNFDGNVEGGFVRVNGANLLAGENFTFDGSAETDARFVVYGGQGTDTLIGGAQSDILFFGQGSFNPGDQAIGGAGYDGMFLRGDYTIDLNAPGYAGAISGIENITLSSAFDFRHHSGSGDGEFDYSLVWNDSMLATGETLTVNGFLLLANETMNFDGATESGGHFRLFGGASADTLSGGAGDDLIAGSLGADMLRGNGGADIFRYQDVQDSFAGAGNFDTILDFEHGVDKIDLSRIDANTLLDGDQGFSFIGANAFSGTGANSAGQLRAFQTDANTNAWQVEGDVDGDGVADIVIQIFVENNQPITSPDFFP